MRRTTLALPAAALAAALGLSACSSGATASSAPSSSPATSVLPSTAATARGSSSATSRPASTAPTVPTAASEVNPAGDIPDNQAYVSWSPRGGGFHVSVPEGWARREGPSGTVFTDKLNSVTVSESSAATPPSTSSETTAVQALSVPGLAAGTSQMQTRTAGTVVVTTYSADAPPDPVTGKVVVDAVERYAFYRNGKTVTITLAGPKGADNVDPWRTITDSFGWQ